MAEYYRQAHTSAMASSIARPLTITVAPDVRVSGLMQRPRAAKACLVLAHGAGAGMTHAFMTDVCDRLAAIQIASLRFQFPYMENHSKRPDAPAACHATIRAAVAEAQRVMPSLPLLAGGKSFGGRMTSQAQAKSPLLNVMGLVFFGFPLHPPKALSIDRAAHLFQVKVPMIFLQGTRDVMADLTLLKPLAEKLGNASTLVLVPDADHSFHVPVRTGRTDPEVMHDLIQSLDQWTDSIMATPFKNN